MYIMVEAMANSVEDVLVDGLSFKLKPGASYINERKSVTFHPQGSNIYSTNGTKLIKILVSGDAWMDPSTFRVQYDLVNNGAAGLSLRPLGSQEASLEECVCYAMDNSWKTLITTIVLKPCPRV